MGKIKITLASGNIVEKPLVTCFQGTASAYIVLDNETNGSMGLPVICISKFINNTAQKITDQNEWNAVKENLKTIISGSALPYLPVPETITAADDFYTQLTLPLASFDLLKNVYAPAVSAAPVTPAPVAAPAAPTMPAVPDITVAPAVPVTPVVPTATPVAPTPVAAPQIVAPLTAEPVQPVTPAIPSAQEVINSVDVVTPTIPATAPVIPEATILEPTSLTAQPANSIANSADLQAIKDNFMKSCENMFDALIQQFNIK